MQRLVEMSLAHRLVVVLLAVLLIGAGWMAFVELPIDAFPDVTNVQVTVISQAPTLSPLEIEQLVTYPIEQSCAGLPHSTEVRSLSKFGLSMVTVVFDDGTDIYFARQLVLERIFTVSGELPDGTSSTLGPISTGLGEVYQYTLESPERGLMELRTLQDWVLRPILRTVPGVAGVDSFGGYVRQFHVVADPAALRRYGLALEELAAAVAANNGVAGGAFVERGGEQFVVRGDGWVRDAGDLEDTVVAYRDNVPVLLSQLAAVELAPEIRQGAISRDGRGETVAGIVLMLRGGSGRDVVAGVEEKLELARRSLPPDVEIVPFYDRNELVTTALGTVRGALVQGAVLVLLVLLFFMGHLRSAVLVAVQLPLAALATFLVMRMFGMSLNLMTLSGLAIAIGMLGDGAIVLVENAVRLLGAEGAGARDRRDVLRQASLEVLRPVAFGVAVIVVVFIPIASLQGMEGKMFAPLAYTIGIALGCALLLTVTLIPTLASFVLRTAPIFGGGRVPHPADVVRRMYRPHLRFALARPWLVIGAALALFALAAVLAPTLGTEFLPTMDEGSIVVQPFQIPSVSLDQALQTVALVESTIMELPEVRHVVSRTGRSDISSDPMGVGESDIYVLLAPRSQWVTARSKDGLVAAIRDKLDTIPGVEFGYTQPIQMRVDELLSGVKSQIAVKIFGDDLSELARLGDEASRIISSVPGAADIKVEAVEGLGYLQITMDRHRMARMGISVAQVRSLIETAIGGRVVTTVPEGDRRTDVVVRLPQSFTAEAENLRDLPLASPTGQRVLLREVADVALVEGPAQISREDGKRRVVVELNVVGRDIGGFVEEAERRLSEELVLPTGSFATWDCQFEQQQRAMARLRPVLMTAATTALGLAPMVWASGVGSEVQRPLAVVVVCGVLTSTLLTLMVLPVLYLRFGGAGSGE